MLMMVLGLGLERCRLWSENLWPNIIPDAKTTLPLSDLVLLTNTAVVKEIKYNMTSLIHQFEIK